MSSLYYNKNKDNKESKEYKCENGGDDYFLEEDSEIEFESDDDSSKDCDRFGDSFGSL